MQMATLYIICGTDRPFHTHSLTHTGVLTFLTLLTLLTLPYGAVKQMSCVYAADVATVQGPLGNDAPFPL